MTIPSPERLNESITEAPASNCVFTKKTLMRVKPGQRKKATKCFVPASIVLTV